MHRTFSICAAVAAVAVFVHSLPGTAPAAPAAGDCPNIFESEPLVVYDVSGFGLGGPIHRHLAVYDNGLASMSSGGSGGGAGGGAGLSDFKFLPSSVAFQLARDLFDAGAWDVCDEFVNVSDIPLTTVTVLRGATTGPSHSYSYLAPESPQALEADQILQDFIATHFPGF